MEENTTVYPSVLSPPPSRKVAAAMPTPASLWSPPITNVDPWSSGSDPWKRDVGSAFADKFRHIQSPAAPTAADTTRALFGSASPPHAPMEVCARRPREPEMSTNISVADARRERYLPSCTCQLPPGISGAATFVPTEAQTISSVVSHAAQTVSGEGSSHLTDDGWAETQ